MPSRTVETEKRECVFCGRKAVAGWIARGHLTPVCLNHQDVAASASASPHTEFVLLSDFRTARNRPQNGLLFPAASG